MNWFKAFRKALTGSLSESELGFVETKADFTPRAMQVLHLARKEADRFNHH